METFYYAMTNDGPRLLSASSSEEATREIFRDYYLRKTTKYVYSVTKEVERPALGWAATDFQMELPI